MESMNHIHNQKHLQNRRKELRHNATSFEKTLWQYLRKKQLGYLFYRQHSIGPYIVDFYCPGKRIIIELDGNQHKHTQEYDIERQYFLESLNHIVLRFWNNEISSNIDHVLLTIRKYL